MPKNSRKICQYPGANSSSNKKSKKSKGDATNASHSTKKKLIKFIQQTAEI